MTNDQKAKFKFWWDEENKIIRYDQFQDLKIDGKVAQEITDGVNQIIKDHPQAGLLVNIAVQKSIPSSQARHTLGQLIAQFGSVKVAFINKNTALRVAVDFILHAAGSQNSSMFSDEQEALKWLKEK